MNDKRLIDMSTLPNYKLRATVRVGEHEMPGELRIVLWQDIENVPIIDAVEVVRCRECRNSQKLNMCADQVYCMVWKNNPRTDGYCYLGAKMDAKDMDVPTKDDKED